MSGLMRRVAVVVVLLFGGLPSIASAREFDSFVEVENDDDLYNLLEENTIDQDGFDSLKELLDTGIDISSASRNELYELPNLTYPVVDAIITYRTEAGGLEDPSALVTAGILSERELLAMAPFIIVSQRKGSAFGAKAWLRYSTLFVGGDSRVPGMALQARADVPGGFRTGLATILTRARIGKVSIDPNRDSTSSRALTAKSPVPRMQLAKAFVEWEQDDYGLIAGTYKIGFGQRLTFDNTGDYTPNGFEKDDTISRGSSLSTACRESTGELDSTPCSAEERARKVAPDFRWTPRLLGVAGGHRRLDVGVGHLQAFGFASYQRRSVYQYEVLERGVCSVEDEANGVCNLSDDFNVYVTQDTPSAQAPEFAYTTLTGLYDELVVGGNVAYWFGERARIGLTGYGAAPRWHLPEMQLDFRRSSRFPFGGPFGAVGLNGTIGFAWWDLGVELTRSFDSQSLGGGDFAAIVRGTGSWKKRELELSLRYYGPNFANPFARPISAADERFGLRAQDEFGARARYAGKVIRDLELRGTADLWVTPSTGTANTRNEVRATYQVSDAIRVSAWGLHQDKNLAVSGHDGNCFETYTGTLNAVDLGEGGALDGCAGMKLSGTAQVRYAPFKSTAITLQYQNAWLDEATSSSRTFDDRFRQDRSFWVTAMVKPVPELRIRARVRYLLEDVAYNDHLESWVWSYLELTYNLMKRFKVRARYDLVVWLDQRDSTALRSPSPEHWFWLNLEAKF